MDVGWPRCRSCRAFWRMAKPVRKRSRGYAGLGELRVIADRLDHGEPVPDLDHVLPVVA